MKSLKHVPEDYRYREVPEWATHSEGDHGYQAYCNWLATYLREHEFTVSPAQSAYVESLQDNTPEGIVIDLADALGYLLWERDVLELRAREGTPYAEIEKEELEQWQENQTNDPDIDEPFEDIKTTPEEYGQICREVKERDKIGNIPSQADIPFRPLLALAVRKCRDTAHAEHVIQLFFDTFNDTASK